MAISYWETQHQTYLNLFSSSGRNIITYNTEHYLKCTFTWFMAGIKISFTSNNFLHSLSPNSNIIFVLSLCCFRMPLKNNTLCYCEWSCIFHGKSLSCEVLACFKMKCCLCFLAFQYCHRATPGCFGHLKNRLSAFTISFCGFFFFCFFGFYLILLI